MRISKPSARATAAAAVAATPFLLTGCVVPSPTPGTGASLNAVAAVSTSNAWAVGQFWDRSGAHDLMEHWDGRTWRLVSLPAPLGSGLTAIAAVNASNLWAVGGGRTLHFNGLSWRTVANPAGVTVSDVASGPDGSIRGLASNGTTTTLLAMTAGGWRTVASIPSPTSDPTCDGGGFSPADLAVVNPRDIWVVGTTAGTGSNGRTCGFTIHWSGSIWRSFATPPLAGEQELKAVSARAANDVWAVGVRSNQIPSTGRWVDNSIVLHWNGVSWHPVASLDQTGGGDLHDVDATAAGVWAIGTSPQLGGFTADMLIKKFSGNAMVDQPVQRLPIADFPQEDSGSLNGVSVRDGAVVSVGDYSPRTNVTATLTDRRNAN